MQGCCRSFSRENAKRNRRIIFSHNSLNTALSGCVNTPHRPSPRTKKFCVTGRTIGKACFRAGKRTHHALQSRRRQSRALSLGLRHEDTWYVRAAQRGASEECGPLRCTPSLVPSRPAAGLSVSPEIPDVTLLRSSRSQRSSRFPALQSLTRQPNKLRTMCAWSQLRVQRRPALLGEQVPGNLSLLRP